MSPPEPACAAGQLRVGPGQHAEMTEPLRAAPGFPGSLRGFLADLDPLASLGTALPERVQVRTAIHHPHGPYCEAAGRNQLACGGALVFANQKEGPARGRGPGRSRISPRRFTHRSALEAPRATRTGYHQPHSKRRSGKFCEKPPREPNCRRPAFEIRVRVVGGSSGRQAGRDALRRDSGGSNLRDSRWKWPESPISGPLRRFLALCAPRLRPGSPERS